MLLHENGNESGVSGSPQRTPLYVDGDYLLGPEAGHLNITGMSGLSTKTSHALFTISSTFQTMKDKKVAALMFNVKGADLLFLDKPVEVDPEDDPELAERYEKAGQRGLPREDREMYESLGLDDQTVREPPHLRAAPAFGRTAASGSSTRQGYRARKDLNTLRNARGEDSCVYPMIWELEDVLPLRGPHLRALRTWTTSSRASSSSLRDRSVRTMADFYAARWTKLFE